MFQYQLLIQKLGRSFSALLISGTGKNILIGMELNLDVSVSELQTMNHCIIAL